MIRIIITILALTAPQFAFALSSSSIPTKIPVYWAQTASGSFSTCPVPTPSQIPITAGRASWTDGFPPLTFLPAVSGGIPPFGQDFNGVLCQISQWTRWFNAGASVPYDATFQSTIGGYPKGAIVPSAVNFGIVWVSTAENNTSNPDTGGSGWQVYSSTFSVSAISGPNQTYSTPQCGLTIPRSNSGSPMADTLPGTGSGVLPKNCPITITNVDTSALLTIMVGNGSAFQNGSAKFNGFIYLGPGQSAQFQSDASNYYVMSSPTRARLGANTTIYFGNSGNDTSNSGAISSSPLLTISRAWSFAQNVIDLNGFVLTIAGADNYTSPVTYSNVAVSLSGPILGSQGASSVIIQGSLATPANAILSGVNGAVTINADMGARFQVQGFTFSGGSQQIRAADAAVINIQTDIFGATASSGSQVTAVQGGTVQIVGNYTINGNAASHYNANSNGVITTPGPSSPTITLSGSPAFSVAFVVAQSNGTFFTDFPITFSGGAGATTVRYAAALNGVINTAGGGANYFPGTSAGTTNTGGQYN